MKAHQLRRATLEDAEACARIYNPYIDSIISFEEETLSGTDMRVRLERCLQTHPWWIAEHQGVILGFAYASAWKQRAAYRRSAESSIYLSSQAAGQGLGKRLYTSLLDDLSRRGYHSIVGGISLPNTASVALHESLGFKKVAQFFEMGHKCGDWVDVGYWQKHLTESDSLFQSERLYARRWKADDSALARRLWGNVQVTEKFTAQPWSKAEIAARLEQEIQYQIQQGLQYWPLFERQSHDFVGAVGLHPYKPEVGLFELGFHLIPHYWGKGLASEAARRVIHYAFETLGIRQLYAGHHPDNAASGRVLQKLGFNYTHDAYYAPTGLKHPSYLLTQATLN